MQARQMAEEYPVTNLDSDALDAARLIAEQRRPGLVVTDNDGHPHSVLGASEVVRFLVPPYVQDDPSLAAVINESLADRVADRLSGKSVRHLLPRNPTELPVVEADDTILEVAALMARTHCPIVAVLDRGTMLGVVTSSRLLEIALVQRQ